MKNLEEIAVAIIEKQKKAHLILFPLRWAFNEFPEVSLNNLSFY